MSETQQTLMQVLVPIATAIFVFLLLGKTKKRTAIGIVLSALLATIIVVGVVVAVQGVTSTLGIGLVFTALIAFAVSGAVLGGLYGITRSRLD